MLILKEEVVFGSYSNIFSGRSSILTSNKNILLLCFVFKLDLGISSIITQIILIREFLSVFYGNELILGIILANWLLLTGLGAYLGKFSEKMQQRIPGADKDPSYWATGISVVLHPQNPNIPSIVLPA